MLLKSITRKFGQKVALHLSRKRPVAGFTQGGFIDSRNLLTEDLNIDILHYLKLGAGAFSIAVLLRMPLGNAPERVQNNAEITTKVATCKATYLLQTALWQASQWCMSRASGVKAVTSVLGILGKIPVQSGTGQLAKLALRSRNERRERSSGQFIGRPQTFVELQLRFKLHFLSVKMQFKT